MLFFTFSSAAGEKHNLKSVCKSTVFALALAGRGLICVTLIGWTLGFTASSHAQTNRDISFNRDIRPILSDKCFQCHGPDSSSREADLRLDRRDDAFYVIEPKSLEDSELYQRIIHEDPESKMPPEHVNKPLTDKEIELLKTWIESGAPWSDFWAYRTPEKTPVPQLETTKKYSNWIDPFVVARLEQNGLTLSPQADKTTLIRRLYFDLVGLPPTPAQVREFTHDSSPDAVEKVVDELLDSKHFGERLAIYWLDLVRYADTVGYHGDQTHNISPYRDWVIQAFNDNMPFDQFTREQIAGDLLPDATESQKIASGYNRLLQTTHEGGLQVKEYSAIYAADRVRNVSLVWMGATVGCAQCHDHKYDPYTAKDFYSLAAFFADVDDEKHFKVGTNALPTNRPPEILVIDDQSRSELTELDKFAADRTRDLATAKKSAAALKQELENPSKEPTPPLAAGRAANLEQLSKQVTELEKELADLKKKRTTIQSRGAWCMITEPLEKPRLTRVLARGNWMDESGEVVSPAIPEFLGELQVSSDRATRLDLAAWMTDASTENGKRTARVFANRFWYLFMGVGVSRSLDDFGGQGEAPAAPELLDNLALEFVENDWNIKQLIRQIVTSETYQQSSFESPEIRKSDPYNQLFSHQSRYRLPAELIRDNALAISGLLNLERVGGKSIKPAQPANYYQHLNFPTRKYREDSNGDQWRRGVYVHWQRMFLHPSLKAFDAPSREECAAERPKSNTPSAALALLNDPIFVESARVFASRVIKEAPNQIFENQLETAFQLAVSRSPEAQEIKILTRLYSSSLKEFNNDAATTSKILAIGQAPKQAEGNDAQLAAWTTVARAVLNMNETITRN
ncbi:MAG: hypothetical protein ACI814_003593 [Mariniblastus sp.]|jgi:hypothetical protein